MQRTYSYSHPLMCVFILCLSVCSPDTLAINATTLRAELIIEESCMITTMPEEGAQPHVECQHRHPYTVERDPAPEAADIEPTSWEVHF